ncbi:MAG: hypothetical protein ACK2UB_07555 [Anaerolineales bacterium]
MIPRTPPDPRLLESLSAYLDGSLEGAERDALERRLERDEALRRELEELRTVRETLRSLPELAPPRPLTLSPAQAGTVPRRRAAFSPRRLAWGSALASLAFVTVAFLDLNSRGAFRHAAATLAPVPMALQAFEARPPDEIMQPEAASEKADASGGGRAGSEPTEAGPGSWESSATNGGAPGEAQTDGCGGGDINADQDMERCEVQIVAEPEPERPSFSLPDLPDAAPYLEAFFGLSAVLLGVCAAVLRRRR